VIHDAEVIELLRDEPELLAVADAVHSTQRSRSPRAYLGLAGALALVAAALAVLIAPWGGGQSITSQALAAIGEGPVVHAVLEFPLTSPPGAERFDLASGERIEVVQTHEVWYDTQRRIFHVISRVNGDAYDDSLSTPEGTFTQGGRSPPSASAQSVNPVIAGFASGYREALESGRARVVGEGEIDGRKVTWLEFQTPITNQTQRVAVESKDAQPIAIQWLTRGRPAGPVIRIRFAETQSVEAANLRRPEVTEPTVETADERELSVAEAQSVLGRSPLWLGRTRKDLALAGIVLQRNSFFYGESRESRGEVLGIKLRYEQKGAPQPIEIREAADPRILQWLGILPPPGTADVFENTARLQRDGLYIVIQAATKGDALNVARSLSSRARP
jgi:hypothetical protein